MLNRDEEGSAQRVVPYLSHGTFARLEIWLRGRATSGTCNCGVWRAEQVDTEGNFSTTRSFEWVRVAVISQGPIRADFKSVREDTDLLLRPSARHEGADSTTRPNSC